MNPTYIYFLQSEFFKNLKNKGALNHDVNNITWFETILVVIHKRFVREILDFNAVRLEEDSVYGVEPGLEGCHFVFGVGSYVNTRNV